MPRYVYACPAGHRYDISEGFDAPAQHRCMEAPKGQQCKETARRQPVIPDVFIKHGTTPVREPERDPGEFVVVSPFQGGDDED